MELLTITFRCTILAAIAAGILAGTGVGISLRSLGSSGGRGHNRHHSCTSASASLGQISFLFNATLFTASFALMDRTCSVFSGPRLRHRARSRTTS
jgi:uncharacterized membrane-anchored protein YitT (DUF2179 family)